jgi:hypothetical protein
MQYIDMPILSRRFRPIQRISRISDQPKDASPGAPDVFFLSSAAAVGVREAIH